MKANCSKNRTMTDHIICADADLDAMAMATLTLTVCAGDRKTDFSSECGAIGQPTCGRPIYRYRYYICRKIPSYEVHVIVQIHAQ